MLVLIENFEAGLHVDGFNSLLEMLYLEVYYDRAYDPDLFQFSIGDAMKL